MNAHQSKLTRILVVGSMMIILMSLLTISSRSAAAEPQTIVADAGDDIADFQIGEEEVLDGSGSSGGSTLYYTWQVVAWPVRDGSDTPDIVDTDHHDEDVGHYICPRSTDPRCVIEEFGFFDADDVGTWTVRLTVDDGVNSDTDELSITIKGFGFREYKPNVAERNHTELSNGCIQPGTKDNHFILEYMVPDVVYENDELNGEDFSMQAPLIALLERLVPLTAEDDLLTRVTDAWDSDCYGHGSNSTHFEGRGIDIKGRGAGILDEENPQEVRRLALRVQQAAEEAGFTLDTDPNAGNKIWIWAEPKYDTNQNRLPGQDHVHVSIKGQHRGPYDFGTICDSAECLTHSESLGFDHSAAAAAEMVLEWQGWTGIQEELFWFGAGSGGTNCETMAGLLNMHIDRGWTCMRFSSLDEALRTAAYWMDVTQAENKEGMPFPVLIPMDGDSSFYGHWVAVQGYIASADPSSQGSLDHPEAGSYEVGGLYVIDPDVDGFNEFAKRFISKYELQGNYKALISELIPNLGMTYALSGPPYTTTNKPTTFELVVPAGCTRGKSNSIMTLAAFASTGGTGIFCDSRYSIASPPPDSRVTATIGQNVRVIGMVPSGIIPYLRVTEILNANGDEGSSIEYLNAEYVSVIPNFFGSSVWEFAWTPSDPYLYKYRLTIIDPLDPEGSCGSVEVIPSSAADNVAPKVSFLQPFNLNGETILIEARHPVPIQIRAIDNQGIREIGGKDSVEVRIRSDRLGIDLPLKDYQYCGPACYQFLWDIDNATKWPDGAYSLTATATDAAGLVSSTSLTVGLGQGDPVKIDSINLQQGQVVENKHAIKITASGGLGDLIANLQITGPDPHTSTNLLIYRGVETQLLEWNPRQEGNYTVIITVYDKLIPSNQTDIRRDVTVTRNDIIHDGEWKKLSPRASPRVRYASMVDTGNGVYLFGGKNLSGGGLSNKLWKWDGSNWTDLTPNPTSNWPVARTYPQLAFDSKRGLLVLFGGIKSDGTILRDLWEYSISTSLWVERTIYPIPHFTKWPSPTYLTPGALGKGSSRMAYDTFHDRTFLLNSYSFFWDSVGGNWEDADIYGGEFDAAAYDSGRNVLVTFMLSGLDILEWDRSQWRTVPVLPNNQEPFYGPKFSKFVGSPFGIYLIGGGASTKELWLWDGTVWTRIYSSNGSNPPSTDYYGASAAYDTARNQLLVYTTNGQTWVYGSKLENLVGAPELFEDEWPVGSGHKVGPGIELIFRPYPHPNVATYETEFSKDGGSTWQTCTNCGVNLDGIVQHHGDYLPNGCGFSYYYCLDRRQTFSYRIRPLNQTGHPMLGWTYVNNITSFDWPAHVEIEAQTPGPYQKGETVTLKLKNSYGQGMNVDWIISPWGSATATVVEGCGKGNYFEYLISQSCTLTISYETALEMQGVAKVATLEPPTSIDVIVTGTDQWNNVAYSNQIVLNFESGEEPPRITLVEPMMYPDEYEPGKKYGPGMRLEWIHSPHPELAFYEIQFSEDGGSTWQVYASARDAQWNWVNHHGNSFCEHGFYRCLNRNQVYHYRIRALDFEETPITDWSNILSATSMEWPAHVEIAATPTGPQYPSNFVVTLDLVNTYGPGLSIQWQLIAQGKAGFEILENTCQNGSFSGNTKVGQCKLRIWVNADSGTVPDDESMKLAPPLMAINSVRINVTATDTNGYQFSDQVDLSFVNRDPDDK